MSKEQPEGKTILLRGSRDQSLELRVFPTSSKEWMRMRAVADVEGFKAYIWDEVLVEGLAKFGEEVKAMYSDLSGKTSLESEDGCLKVEGEMNSLGHIEWTVEMRSERLGGPCMSFRLLADQTYLPDVIRQTDEAQIQ